MLLTEEGVEKLEKRLGIDNIYAPENYRLTRYMEAALKAQIIYQRDATTSSRTAKSSSSTTSPAA